MNRNDSAGVVYRRTTMIASALLVIISFGTLLSAPIGEGANKFLGNITTSEPVSNYGNYWNQITLENNGKWDYVEPNRDQMKWESVTAAYNYCQKNKIPYKHHTFVWGMQYPKWMDNLSAKDQKDEVEELIKTFGEKFPETAMIDVVNESREKSPKWKEALGGAGTTGCDWIVWSFEMARKYNPKAKLLINEYYCEYSLEFVTEYLKIINVLKEKKLIDGIGLQCHDGETKKAFQLGMLKKCLDSLATSSLPLYCTEFDMSGNDAEQLKFYQDIFPIIWEHPAMKGVTLWGWIDSWLLDLTNPKDGRLVINNQERPALKWLRQYVGEHLIVEPPTIVNRSASSLLSTFASVYVRDGLMLLSLDDSRPVSLRVFDPAGRLVVDMPQKQLGRGEHRITMTNGKTPQGCYLYSLGGERAGMRRGAFLVR